MISVLNLEETDLLEYFTLEELEATFKELVDMEKHPEKYKSYNNVGELFEDLEKND